jgi:hypothetical protein
MILGIDPGTGKRRCGLALVSGGKLFRHKTVDGKDAITHAVAIHMVYHFDRCVIEKPRLGVIYAKHLTKSNKVISEAGRAKLAMNVGQNIQLTNDITRALEGIGVKVKQVPPKNKATKWRKEYWAAVFKWEGRVPSEHARDAAVIALQ